MEKHKSRTLLALGVLVEDERLDLPSFERIDEARIALINPIDNYNKSLTLEHPDGNSRSCLLRDVCVGEVDVLQRSARVSEGGGKSNPLLLSDCHIAKTKFLNHLRPINMTVGDQRASTRNYLCQEISLQTGTCKMKRKKEVRYNTLLKEVDQEGQIILGVRETVEYDTLEVGIEDKGLEDRPEVLLHTDRNQRMENITK